LKLESGSSARATRRIVVKGLVLSADVGHDIPNRSRNAQRARVTSHKGARRSAYSGRDDLRCAFPHLRKSIRFLSIDSVKRQTATPIIASGPIDVAQRLHGTIGLADGVLQSGRMSAWVARRLSSIRQLAGQELPDEHTLLPGPSQIEVAATADVSPDLPWPTGNGADAVAVIAVPTSTRRPRARRPMPTSHPLNRSRTLGTTRTGALACPSHVVRRG
jgi:hypothetical protein